MPVLRIATYNIAWFARLFDRRNRLVADAEGSALEGVSRARQAEAVAEVLRRVDADCFAVIEAPNSGHRQDCVAELEGFAARFGLRQRAGLIGFVNPTEQEIALLYDPDRLRARHDPIGEVLDGAEARAGLPFGAPRFDSVYPVDLQGDGRITLHSFLKPPLEAVVEDRAAGARLRLVAVHLKSRAGPEEGDRRARRDAAEQRAQALWLRARLEAHLEAGEPVIALGDFNDGPGAEGPSGPDGRSSLEVVLGDPARPETRMVTPFLDPPPEGLAREALIDFILLSPDLAARTRPRWRVWHPQDDPQIAADAELRAALMQASDHFPVSVDLEF